MICSLIGIFLLLLSSFVFAAVPPSAQMHLTYNGQDISEGVFHAVLLGCQRIPAVHPPSPVPQLNISEYDSIKNCRWEQWNRPGVCQDSNCQFWYAPHEFKLAVYLPSMDKIFLSAEVTNKEHKSVYEANLLPDGSISLQETTLFSQTALANTIKQFIIALLLILIIEIIVAFVFISVKGISKKLLISVLIANIISFPIIWFIFRLLRMGPLDYLFGQIFAFVFEAYFIYLLNKQIITLKRAFVLSLAINLASLIIGGVISWLLMIFY